MRVTQYSIKHESGESSRAKGIQKAAIKNKDIRHENYLEALDGKDVKPYPNTTIQSKNHVVVSTSVTTKKTLCLKDTKRIRVTKEFAYALGHYKLDTENKVEEKKSKN